VILTPSSDGSITLAPHPIYDPTHFANLRQLSTVAGREGYNGAWRIEGCISLHPQPLTHTAGGLRLLQAALHRFFLHCRRNDIDLPGDRGFVAHYHTTVPRQVGLAGSSAIVTAFMKALLAFYGEALAGHRVAMLITCGGRGVVNARGTALSLRRIRHGCKAGCRQAQPRPAAVLCAGGGERGARHHGCVCALFTSHRFDRLPAPAVRDIHALPSP